MIQNPTFNNKSNILHKINGKEIWESRSVAISATIFAIYNDNIYALVEKRSSIMDRPYEWCLPCGYLDYNESGWDAIIREVYEETSFYIPRYDYFLVTDNDKNPFRIITEPNASYRQNVILEYGIIFDFGTYEKRFPSDIVKYKNEEISEIKWIFIEEVFKYKWAFEHDCHIEYAVHYFQKYLI